MAAYAIHQIVLVPPSVVKIGESTYARPFLIYGFDPGVMYALPISTKVATFFDERRDFLMMKTDDGFATTGLTDECFAKNQEAVISASQNLKIIGHLSGELLDRFREFAKRHNL